jgi:hypothetical protein
MTKLMYFIFLLKLSRCTKYFIHRHVGEQDTGLHGLGPRVSGPTKPEGLGPGPRHGPGSTYVQLRVEFGPPSNGNQTLQATFRDFYEYSFTQRKSYS